MRYAVTTCALDLTAPDKPKFVQYKERTGITRTEEIDTQSNGLFAGCKSEWDVADQYEAFWNRLDDNDEKMPCNCHNQTARVVVINVRVIE